MSKFWVIFRREYAQVVKKKSFIIGIFITPLLMGAFMVLPALLATSETTSAERVAVIDRGGMGFGDEFVASLDKYKLPDTEDPAYDIRGEITVDPSDTTRFNHIYDSLVTGIRNEGLKYLLVINPDAHLSDTNLRLVTNSDNFRTIGRFESILSDILSSQRLREANVNLPVDSVLTLTRGVDLPRSDTKGEAIPFMTKYFTALVFVFMIYMMIIGYGSTLMRSVIKEKNSRIMEVLVSSTSPFQMMLGKVMGLGAAAFTQVGIWVVIGLGIFLMSGSWGLAIDPSLARMVFNPVIVIFFVLFFTSGYIMYSTWFAFIGSIVNTDKEAQNFIFPVILFLIIPIIAGMSVVQDPYVAWAQVVSYVPFCAPTMMMMRILFIAPTAESYSLFSGVLLEGTISFLVTVLTTIAMIWITARVFRIGILMYGKRPNLPEIIRWVRYK